MLSIEILAAMVRPAGRSRRCGGPRCGRRHDGPARRRFSPSLRVVGLLGAQHRERETMRTMPDRDGRDGGALAVAAKAAAIIGEVVVVAREPAAQFDDRFSKLDRTFPTDVLAAASTSRGRIFRWDETGRSIGGGCVRES